MIGIILAGGLSSRMGENKALLAFKDAKLLDYMLSLLKNICEEVYISGSLEGYNCIPDKTKQLGPIGGISAVLKQLNDTEILFVPVDMPCLTVDILQTLKLNNYDAVAFENSPLPVLLKNNAEIRNKIDKQISTNKLSIKNTLQQLNTSYIPILKGGFLQNANTPTEWKSIKEKAQ